MNVGTINRWSKMKVLRSCGYNPQRLRAARSQTVPSRNNKYTSNKNKN